METRREVDALIMTDGQYQLRTVLKGGRPKRHPSDKGPGNGGSPRLSLPTKHSAITMNRQDIPHMTTKTPCISSNSPHLMELLRLGPPSLRREQVVNTLEKVQVRPYKKGDHQTTSQGAGAEKLRRKHVGSTGAKAQVATLEERGRGIPYPLHTAPTTSCQASQGGRGRRSSS